MAPNSAPKIQRLDSQPYAPAYSGGLESQLAASGPRPFGELQVTNPQEERGLRTYTEVQVAAMLQISRSQLRKWRMGWSRGRREGPPFKKFGRVIRYPESGLRAYIYGP